MSKKNELQKKPLAPLTTTLERLVAQNQDNFPFETRTAQRLQQNAIMTVAQNAKLMEVAIKNPGALAMQVYNFVALGLDMNMKEAYLVPFGNEIVPIIDYKGLVKLVNNFGKPEVSKIDFDLVREKDYINMENGKLTHTYKPFFDRGGLIGVYCSVLYENGETVYTLVDKEEIEKVKSTSKSSSGKDSPWNKWEESMWIKTAIRKAMKTITLDFGKYDELHRTFERADDDVDFNNFNPNRENKDVVINQEDILDAETGEYEEVEIEL